MTIAESTHTHYLTYLDEMKCASLENSVALTCVSTTETVELLFTAGELYILL